MVATMELIESGKIAVFDGPIPVGVSVLTVLQGANELAQETVISSDGRLQLSPQQFNEASGFKLLLSIPANEPVLALHRNLNRLHGDYSSFSIVTLRGDNWNEPVQINNIPVIRRYLNGKEEPATVWTSWKGPNRIDLWKVDPNNGQVTLFQVGVVVRGEGENQYFRVASDLRGIWNMFQYPDGRISGIPERPVWGAFSVRERILKNQAFSDLLDRVTLSHQTPPDNMVDPPLSPIPTSPSQDLAYARMQWSGPFTGIRDQGPCELQNGSSGWVCGQDVTADSDEDGIVRLHRDTLISYKGLNFNWGFDEKPSDAPKLLGVERVPE